MIGERIKKLREQKRYSITELAELSNVSKSYLSYIERDLNKNPSIQFLMKVAKPLDVSIEYLLIGVDQIENQFDSNSEKYLDKEWEGLVEKAIKDGIEKEDFKEYINYIKFKIWEKNN
ncbi:helix-turn-helix domain-containing protein, partial [Neobacillus niacini]|uniref:helix-turn-helix domain-containing protein n=1 Tax=Neobacillus niacini TaxID=86668 RepID=UPI002FFD5A49